MTSRNFVSEIEVFWLQGGHPVLAPCQLLDDIDAKQDEIWERASFGNELSNSQVEELRKELVELSKQFPDVYFHYEVEDGATGDPNLQFAYYWVCQGKEIEKYAELVGPKTSFCEIQKKVSGTGKVNS